METPLPDYEIRRRSPGPSWLLLIAGTAALMLQNVWYTGGEGGWIFHLLGSALTVLCLLVGFGSRPMAAWLILITGGSLILWHAWETRRWGILQEEVIAILDYAGHQKTATGAYPPNLDAYSFRDPGTRGHIRYHFYEGKLMVTYPMTGQAVFWHHEDGGFLFNGD